MNLFKIISIFLLFFVLSSCKKNNSEPLVIPEWDTTIAKTILKNNGMIYIAGDGISAGSRMFCFWENGIPVESSYFNSNLSVTSLVKNGLGPDDVTRFTYVESGTNIVVYDFPRLSPNLDTNKIIYYKDTTEYVFLSVSYGYLSAIYIKNSSAVFAGSHFTSVMGEDGQYHPAPSTAFLLNQMGNISDNQESYSLQELLFSFSAINCIYIDGDTNYYIGGFSYENGPIYLKNGSLVELENKFGIVNQIIEFGTNVFAVGLYNKNNYNSTGHTACYWINGKRVDIEDDSQAYGLFVDGNDIYVCGAIGQVPRDYKACYWKNGIRVNLQ